MSTARIGFIVDGSDQFVRPIETAVRTRYQGSRFAPRFVRMPVIGASTNKVLFQRQLARFLDDHDVVFFEWAGSTLIEVSHMRKRCKIVVRLHSIELATAAHLIDWSQVDVVIVTSRHIEQRLLSIANVPPRAIQLVPNGIDLNRYLPGRRDFSRRLGMLCRIVPVKRVYEVVLCLAELRRQGYPFTLDVVGKKGEGEELRYYWSLVSLIDKLRLQHVVTLHGFVEQASVWYQSIDVFLSNSYWEGQQVALLEAMAAGCYCLGHCWDGIEEILPPENIYTTDGDLRAKLLAYAALPAAAQRAAQAHMRAIAEERFDERRMVRQIVELIEQVARQ